MDMSSSRIAVVISLVAAWLVIVGLLILQFWPNLPESNLGWFLFIMVGPPLYVVGEEVGASILRRRQSNRTNDWSE